MGLIEQWGNYQFSMHCYEAKVKNCVKLESRIQQNHWNQKHVITLHKAALWDKSGELLHFVGSGLSSNLNNITSDRESESVITECIDDFEYRDVAFIKMDIEGAERRALEGARKRISHDRPILAICAYHLQDDLLVLSNIIKSIDREYVLYLRHYMNSSGDTILYAISKDDLKIDV